MHPDLLGSIQKPYGKDLTHYKWLYVTRGWRAGRNPLDSQAKRKWTINKIDRPSLFQLGIMLSTIFLIVMSATYSTFHFLLNDGNPAKKIIPTILIFLTLRDNFSNATYYFFRDIRNFKLNYIIYDSNTKYFSLVFEYKWYFFPQAKINIEIDHDFLMESIKLSKDDLSEIYVSDKYFETTMQRAMNEFSPALKNPNINTEDGKIHIILGYCARKYPEKVDAAIERANKENIQLISMNIISVKGG